MDNTRLKAGYDPKTGATIREIRCVKCGRFLGATSHNTDTYINCPNCHAFHRYKIRFLSTMGDRYSQAL